MVPVVVVDKGALSESAIHKLEAKGFLVVERELRGLNITVNYPPPTPPVTIPEIKFNG